MAKQTRIAFVRRSYEPNADGGAERIIARLLDGLSAGKETSNLVVSMIAQKCDANAGSGIDVIKVKRRGLTRSQKFRAFSQDVSKLLDEQKFDIVQSHERIPGCQIYRAGDGVHKQWLALRKRFLSSRVQSFTWDYSVYHRTMLQAEQSLFSHPRLAKVICNSNQIKSDILRHYPETDSNKLAVIYNGIDLDKYKPANKTEKQLAREDLGIASDARVALFVGSGFERKGLRLLLEAMVKAPDWNLLVVGGEKRIQHYQGLSERLGLTERVRFCGVHSNVLPFYAAADLLVHPAYYDPAPNVVLEALACGLGVIVSDTCGNAELISHGKEGFIVPVGEVAAITGILHLIGDNQQDFEDTSIRARQLASKFPISRMVAEASDLYRTVLRLVE